MTLLDDPLLTDAPVVDGFKVLDPCVLLSKLGAGGMGAVYRGRHMNLNVDVAVKCLKRLLAAEDGDFVVRFKREAMLAATVKSENLVGVYDVREGHGLHYLVMEFVEGETLRERVERKGPLAVDEAVALVTEAARGLAAAHRRGVVHRDVKPDNILVSREGDVKVADLGLATAAESLDSLKTATHMVMGTPQYMPPEQFRGASGAKAPADVYALAATLYYLLAGRNAMDGPDVTAVMLKVMTEPFPDIRTTRPEVPQAVADVIAKATQKDPDDRFADAAELEAVLRGWLGPTVHRRVRDPDTGRGTPRCSLVSPPPEHSLRRIRASLATSPAVGPAKEAPRGEVTAGARPSRRRVLLALGSMVLVAVALVLVALEGDWLSSGAGSEDGTGRPKEADTPEIVAGVPVIALDAPAPGDGWLEPPVAVKGRVEHPGQVTVAVNGQEVPIFGDGRFEASLDLESGRRTITIVARDEDGRESRRAVPVDVDRTPPVIRAEPAPSRTSRRELRIRTEVSDDGQVSSVTIGAQPAMLDGRFWIATVALESEGANAIEIVARDRADHESKERLTVERDTRPPVLLVTVPEEGATVEPGLVTVSGTLDDGRCRVEVDGHGVEIARDGRWTFKLRDVPAGARTIRVTAEDFIGNDPVRVARHIQVRPAAPKMRVPTWAREVAGTAAGENGWAKEITESKTGMPMVLIPSGSFDMGSPESEKGDADERPVHRVGISRPFYLGKYEVTNAQFRRFNEDHDSGEYRGLTLNGTDQPVVQVSWVAARNFLKWLDPKAFDRDRDGHPDGFRLPSEAEWEYACRAGTSTAYPWGDRELQVKGHANVLGPMTKKKFSFSWDAFSFDDGVDVAASVGRFRANAFGLHDMIGNVWEWCQDAFDSDVYGSRSSGEKDPRVTSGSSRVLRGGSWNDTPRFCRSAYRDWNVPPDTYGLVGFRCSRTPFP